MRVPFKHLIASTILACLTLIPGFTKPQSQQPSLQSKPSGPIQLHVTITDKAGNLITDLNQNNFAISVEKKLAKVVSFSNEDSPVSIGIVFDSSGSMGGGSNSTAVKNFMALRLALGGFLRLSNPSNEYFLMGFNTRPQLLVDWTSDEASIVDGFADLTIIGTTAFYDACYLAVDKLQSSRHRKRVLILFSDGQDNSSRYTFNEVREAIRKSGILLYAVHFPDDTMVGALGVEGFGVLEDLTSLSGGESYFSKYGAPLKRKDANSVLESIANELRHQYAISIVPEGPIEVKKWNKIKIKLEATSEETRKLKNLRIRSRDGFYPGQV